MRTIALSFALLSLTSCIMSSPAKGPVEERTIKTTEEITGIAVSGGLNVIIDDTIPYGQVRIFTNSDVFEYVEVEVIDNTLNLGMKSCPIRPGARRCESSGEGRHPAGRWSGPCWPWEQGFP